MSVLQQHLKDVGRESRAIKVEFVCIEGDEPLLNAAEVSRNPA